MFAIGVFEIGEIVSTERLHSVIELSAMLHSYRSIENAVVDLYRRHVFGKEMGRPDN